MSVTGDLKQHVMRTVPLVTTLGVAVFNIQFVYFYYTFLSRRSRQRERLSASVLFISSVRLSVCLFVCRSPKYKNAIFSKTKQFRAMVSIDDL